MTDDSPGVAAVRQRPNRIAVIAFLVLPILAVLLGGGAGYLKWLGASRRFADMAAVESVAAARDATTAILSYNADTAENDLNAARDRLTGPFLDSYTKLVNEVVIPGSRERGISTVAQVAAAASVSATPAHAVVLVFVNQSVTIGSDAPTNTSSSVRVTLKRDRDHWLVSGFDPV